MKKIIKWTAIFIAMFCISSLFAMGWHDVSWVNFINSGSWLVGLLFGPVLTALCWAVLPTNNNPRLDLDAIFHEMFPEGFSDIRFSNMKSDMNQEAFHGAYDSFMDDSAFSFDDYKSSFDDDESHWSNNPCDPFVDQDPGNMWYSTTINPHDN